MEKLDEWIKGRKRAKVFNKSLKKLQINEAMAIYEYARDDENLFYQIQNNIKKGDMIYVDCPNCQHKNLIFTVEEERTPTCSKCGKQLSRLNFK